MMAMLFVFMVIMGLLLMKAQPYARAQVMRDREAELVFRGEAMARAIKLFQLRMGQYPSTLDEMVLVRPRILRRVYKDPMVPDGEWRKLYAVQPGASGDTTGLPIVGVASKSDEDRTYRVYQGKTMYSDWHFRADSNVFGLPGVIPALNLPAGNDGKQPAPIQSAGEKR
jgi:type II secretory pathway pseudopilin PulG